jgi:serine/threonine protein kinase
MGEIWQGRDANLNIEVALKQVIIDPQASPERREAAMAYASKEAQHAVALRSHPNIVTVHDVIENEGMLWMVMDLVNGRSLAAVLKQDGTLTTKDAIAVAQGVLAALRAAHELGIIHRDVKPSNIMLDNTGHVWLTDFGIARNDADTKITNTGTVVGTPEYMAPERFHDKTLPAADLWALGATLYEATEGVSPFRRDSLIATINAVNTFQPPAPKNSGRLTELITGLLDKDPNQRLTTVQAEEVLAGRDTAETLTTPTSNESGARHQKSSHNQEIPSGGSPGNRILKFTAMAVIPLLAVGGITAATLLMKDVGAEGNSNSKISSSPTASTSRGTASVNVPRAFGPTTGVAINAEPYCTIQSNYTGGYLGAVAGGGLPTGALQLGAPVPDTWERFKLVSEPSDDPPAVYYAIQTVNGNFITVIGGDAPTGGMHTDATTASGWEEFEFVPVNGKGLYAIRTRYGYYLSGVNGGGSLPGDPVSTTSTIGPRGVWRIICGLSEAQS